MNHFITVRFKQKFGVCASPSGSISLCIDSRIEGTLISMVYAIAEPCFFQVLQAQSRRFIVILAACIINMFCSRPSNSCYFILKLHQK